MGIQVPRLPLCGTHSLFIYIIRHYPLQGFVGRMDSAARKDQLITPFLFIEKSKLSQGSAGASKNMVLLC